VFGDDGGDDIPQTQTSLPDDVETGLTHLLTLVTDESHTFEPTHVEALIDYSQAAEIENFSIQPKRREGGQSALMPFEVNVPLEDILRYAFHPQIPKFIIFPNLLRLSGWQAGSDILKRSQLLADELKEVDTPLLLRGQEFEVTSPDPKVNTYFRYDVQRLLLMKNYKAGKVFISVSNSAGPSEVGKKAVIIDDTNWNYFYSGIAGVNKPFIGWAKAHLYHRASVFVFYQPHTNVPRTHVLLLNWVKAGWKGMNVVKRKHIYEGCVRYANSLKKLMETTYLPPEAHLAQSLQSIQQMDHASIDAKIRQYAVNFERIAHRHKDMSDGAFAQIIADGGYFKLLTPQERVGVLQLEFFKSQLGKPCLVELNKRNLTKNSLVYLNQSQSFE
jgi:hypothetical protein